MRTTATAGWTGPKTQRLLSPFGLPVSPTPRMPLYLSEPNSTFLLEAVEGKGLNVPGKGCVRDRGAGTPSPRLTSLLTTHLPSRWKLLAGAGGTAPHLCFSLPAPAPLNQRLYLHGLMSITTNTARLLFSSAPFKHPQNPSAEATFLRVSAGGRGRRGRAGQAARRGGPGRSWGRAWLFREQLTSGSTMSRVNVAELQRSCAPYSVKELGSRSATELRETGSFRENFMADN